MPARQDLQERAEGAARPHSPSTLQFQELGQDFRHCEYHLSFLKHFQPELRQHLVFLQLPHLPMQEDGAGAGACVVNFVSADVVVEVVTVVDVLVVAFVVDGPFVRTRQIQGVGFGSLGLIPGVQERLHCA
mmetsp:Transcript_139134/g.432908  ORF Transcript_139134/g.432908 Transcript_139134/m.432908 type:complete len:131 (+) Transcript_139134:458-850(+)